MGDAAKEDVKVDEGHAEEHSEQPLTAEDLRVMFECKIWKEVKGMESILCFKSRWLTQDRLRSWR